MMTLEHDTWIFGYGSLIWRPGFDYVEARQALLRGAHRSLCIYSHHHRGTSKSPGLVFGLVQGGACRGMAFKVDPSVWPAVRDYLREREQITGVYREVFRPISLDGGEKVLALTYVVDQTHAQYAGRLDLEVQARLVSTAHGNAGPNRDYVLNTARHLEEMGIRDEPLLALSRRLL